LHPAAVTTAMVVSSVTAAPMVLLFRMVRRAPVVCQARAALRLFLALVAHQGPVA